MLTTFNRDSKLDANQVRMLTYNQVTSTCKAERSQRRQRYLTDHWVDRFEGERNPWICIQEPQKMIEHVQFTTILGVPY